MVALRVATGILLALVLSTPSGAASWTQLGGNPAHTFSIEGRGPRMDETAFEVLLPGQRVSGFPMLIDDEAVHLLLNETVDSSSPAQIAAAVFEVTLAAAVVTRVVEAPPEFDGWAMDDARYYFAVPTGVLALARDGTVAWTWAAPDVQQSDTGVAAPSLQKWCTPPIVKDGIVYVACTAEQARHPVAAARPRAAIAAIHADSGEPLWVANNVDNLAAVDSLALIGPMLFTGEWRQSRDYHAHVMALDLADGSCHWFIRQHGGGASVNPEDLPLTQDRLGRLATLDAIVVGTESQVIVDFETLRGYDVASPDAPCDNEIYAVKDSWILSSPGDALGTTHLSYRKSLLYVARGSILERAELTTNPTIGAFHTLDPLEYTWTPESVVTAENGLYAISTTVQDVDPASRTLHFFDHDGNPPVSHPFLGMVDDSPSLSDGIFAYTMVRQRGGPGVSVNNHFLVILGETDASIQPGIVWPQDYPAVGVPVQIDTSSTKAGAFPGEIERRVDWGDGSITSWQNGTLFAHSYHERGDKTIEVHFRNQANQSSVASYLLHVGAERPVEPNVIARTIGRAFEPAQQETTFFVLGLLLTLVAAAFGFARVQKRRRRLRKELKAIDRALAITKGQSVEFERALAERRAHVRGLLLDGSIDEAQYAVLNGHLEGLAKHARIETIEDQMGFLPVSIARTLRSLLADGRIEKWERSHFFDVVEKDPHMSAKQKSRVRQQIDDWFASDATAVHEGREPNTP